MNKSPLLKVQCFVFAVMSILLAILLIYIGTAQNIKENQSRQDRDYTVVSDVSFEKIEDPEAPVGTVAKYSFVLDDILQHDMTLAFYSSHHYIDVYLDDENIYSLRPSEDISNVRTVGSSWTMIPLYNKDAGKEVSVVLTPVYKNFQNQDIHFLIGSELAIYKAQFKQSLPELALSLIVVIVGLMLLCAAVYNTVKKGKGLDFYALGLLAVSMGLWRFTDTKFSPFILEDKPMFLFYVSVTMLMICAIPMIKSVKKRERKISSQVLEYCGIICGVVYIIQLFLQITGVIDLREILSLTHIMILFSSLALIASGILEQIRPQKKDDKPTQKNYVWLLGVGAIIDLTIYYVSGTSSGLLVFLISILCYVLFEGAKLVLTYIHQKAMLEEKEIQLTLSRTTTMMSQIRSHFVFNLLNAISGMCKYDAEKADETVVRFARYLRNNIDIMEDDKPIPFTTDLQQLEDYVILEQVRFGDKIEFVTDIEVNQFMIPPLILQPVVENAIKHGITKKQDGGTILLRTWEEGENIKIEVEDDGVGFDIQETKKEKSVGLKNIRFRLLYLMKGTLDISSKVGRGTTVTITIPKKEAEKCT